MRRNRIKDVGLTREKLAELYASHTDAVIASMFGVTDVAIGYFRRRWGIQSRTQRQRADQARGGLALEDLTPARLADLYASMGDNAIGRLYGVSKPTIRKLREQWGIGVITKSERATRRTELTSEQKEAIIGTMLGDGHLLERGVLKVSHYQEQIGYLKYLHGILQPHVLPITYGEKVMDNGRLTFTFGFNSVQHEWLRALRSVFYPEGVRIFPESTLRDLSARSLAFWYFDDGQFNEGQVSIALGNLDDLQSEAVSQLVGDRFSLATYIKPGSSPCRSLGVRASSADRFFELIREFAVPDMLYKFPVKHWPKGAVPHQPVKTSEPTLLPGALVEEAKLWGSLGPDSREALLEAFVQFWSKVGFPHHTPRPEELSALSNLEQHHVIQDDVIKAHQVGQSVCQGIVQHIWDGRSYDGLTPRALFNEHLRDLLRFVFEMGGVPNAAQVRSALRYWKRSGVYNFRPSAAKALVDRFCRFGGTVLDPCAGYGGRLLGTLLSASQAHYVGIDPSTQTIEGLHRLHCWVESFVPMVQGRTTLVNAAAEDVSFPVGVDLVLTSPPYWKREVYSSEPTQSAERYSTYDAWLQVFWRGVILKSSAALRPGGWLVLNVDDFSLGGRDYKLIEDTLSLVADLGFGKAQQYKYQLPRGNFEVVLCWSKGPTVGLEPTMATPVQVTSCSACGRAIPFTGLHGGLCVQCLSPKGFVVVCKGCGEAFHTIRRSKFHGPACYARYRRKMEREAHPPSAVRVFTCRLCGENWATAQKGSFHFCPECADKREVAGRSKHCEYRYCENPKFVDTSPKNSMRYCCPEHRRREKLFRSGKVLSVDQFRGPHRR